MKSKIKLKGKFDIILRDTLTGKIKSHDVYENMIVNVGYDQIMKLIAGLQDNSINPMKTLGLGWAAGGGVATTSGMINFQGTPLYEQTREQGIIGHPTVMDITITYTWAAGQPSMDAMGNPVTYPLVINQLGVFTEKAGYGDNEMISRVAKPSGITKESTDELEVTYTLTVV